MVEDAWKMNVEALGEFIRTQRKLAKLSLRELAGLTDLSNAYLSQIERGLHEPSIRVVKSIATAFNLPAEALLEHAGLLDDETAGTTRRPRSGLTLVFRRIRRKPYSRSTGASRRRAATPRLAGAVPGTRQALPCDCEALGPDAEEPLGHGSRFERHSGSAQASCFSPTSRRVEIPQAGRLTLCTRVRR
jgi:transcriptional regulator with XRE-family HTH domain